MLGCTNCSPISPCIQYVARMTTDVFKDNRGEPGMHARIADLDELFE